MEEGEGLKTSGGGNSWSMDVGWAVVGSVGGCNTLEGADRQADLVTELNPHVTVSQRQANFFGYCLSFLHSLTITYSC